jgi:hypothetical protein
MSGVELGRTIRRGGAVFAALTLAALAAGCSTDRLFGSDQPSTSTQTASGQTSPSASSRGIMETILQKPPEPTAAEKQAAVASAAESVCPTVDVRLGAGTLLLPPGNTDPLSLRYQGSLGAMARECKVTGGTMRMKVGIEGRVLVGPAGGAGTIDVPLRFAVVKEGPEPKTVVSKLSKVAVTIPDGQQNVIFSHVDNDIAFPMPPGLEIDAYVVYVGFDPIGDKQSTAKKPQAKPVRR